MREQVREGAGGGLGLQDLLSLFLPGRGDDLKWLVGFRPKGKIKALLEAIFAEHYKRPWGWEN